MSVKTKNFLVIGDCHFHNFTEFSKPDELYLSDRFKEQMDTLQEIFNLARVNGAAALFLGDIFHKRGSVHTTVFNHVFDTFAGNADVETYIVRGNHDSVNNSIFSDSSLQPFRHLPHVTVITEPEIITKGHVKFTCLPYGHETDFMKDFIKTAALDPTQTNILLGHIGVDGAVVGQNSFKMSDSFALYDLRPDDFDYILLGHYHKPQMLSGNPNFIYAGSIIQNSFSDEGDVRGVYLLSVPEEKGKSRLEFLPLNTRMFVTISGANIPANIDSLIEHHFVRFIGNQDQAKALEKLSTDIDLTTLRVMVEKDYSSEVRLEIDSASTPEEVTRAYAEQNYPKATAAALECIQAAKLI